jgi:1-acyl-sn-glycerol-3-phosphate acyltransferase
LVCNHISGLDPVLIQSVCPRLIVWMMAREYYEQPGLRWIFEQVLAIPLERGRRDMSAMRRAMRAVADGHVLGVFPEGRIETRRELLPFQTGVASMAIKTGVPVFPAHIEGTQRGKPMLSAYLKPQWSTVAFGPKIDLSRCGDGREDVEVATNVLENAVWKLMQGI